MKNFIMRWGRFLGILFSPDVIAPTLIALVFGYWAITSTDAMVKAVGSVVMALMTGLAGARISKNILEESRKGQIFTRGQSAVRGLNLILSNLGTLEAQIEQARANCENDIIIKDFSYLKTLSIVIQRQAINSIEEWKDILPEADILELIEELKSKANERDDLREALDQVQQQLDESQNTAGIKEEQVNELKMQKQRLEKKLREKELEAIRIIPSTFGSGSLLGTSPETSVSSLGLLSSSSNPRIIQKDDGTLHLEEGD
ncbi:MAG: hypothetical protein KZQ75_08585 [Candidatus Thiodiazotropha sp. (ex Myrtea spinifera)]|nr:hypothetical protein [Candidatus Thiodiazotropha sp. (ex Myrtea spinifera)]